MRCNIAKKLLIEKNLNIWLDKSTVTLNMPIYKKINKNFFKEWTPDMAYVLGFFAADGTITYTNRGTLYWSIQIVDKDLLLAIKKSLKAEHKIVVKKPHKKSESILYRLQIGSKEMCNDLTQLGFGRGKTHNMTLPTVPQKYIGDFVRGYFDGDGNVWFGHINKHRKNPSLLLQTAFTSCSEKFLRNLQDVLLYQGLGKGTFYSKNDTFYRLQYGTKDSLKLFDFMYNGDYSSRGLFLKRKRKKFEEYKRMRP